MKRCRVNDYRKSFFFNFYLFFVIGNIHGRGSLAFSSALSVVPLVMEEAASANLAILQSNPTGERAHNVDMR